MTSTTRACSASHALARAAMATVLILLSGPLAGCCFGAVSEGFSEGFNTQIECTPLIDAVNRANSTVIAVPEASEGGTQAEQDAEFNALALAYEQAVSGLNAVTLTQATLIALRGELVALYQEAAAAMHAMPMIMASAVATGDMSAMQAQVTAMEGVDAREQSIISRINAACER